MTIYFNLLMLIVFQFVQCLHYKYNLSFKEHEINQNS